MESHATRESDPDRPSGGPIAGHRGALTCRGRGVREAQVLAFVGSRDTCRRLGFCVWDWLLLLIFFRLVSLRVLVNLLHGCMWMGFTSPSGKAP